MEGGKVETVADFIFLGSKTTADCDCSHEIKSLTPWKKSYDKTRQHIKRQRHHFVGKGLYSQSYGFSSSCVWMWELYHKESWAPKNWCFQTVALGRLLRVSWTARRSNQSILKEISPEYSLEDRCWSSNALATWYKEPTHWKRSWCWEKLKAKEE